MCFSSCVQSLVLLTYLWLLTLVFVSVHQKTELKPLVFWTCALVRALAVLYPESFHAVNANPAPRVPCFFLLRFLSFYYYSSCYKILSYFIMSGIWIAPKTRIRTVQFNTFIYFRTLHNKLIPGNFWLHQLLNDARCWVKDKKMKLKVELKHLGRCETIWTKWKETSCWSGCANPSSSPFCCRFLTCTNQYM